MEIASILVSGLSALLGADALLHLACAFKALRHIERPPAFLLEDPPVIPEFESFSISSPGGGTIWGAVFFPAHQSAKGLILFCPEARGSSHTAMCYASALVEAGFIVVALDFRCDAAAEPGTTAARPIHWVSEAEIADVQAVLEFIEQQPRFDDLPLGIFGVSRGAAAALVAGAMSHRVSRVVAQGAFSTKSLQLYHCRRWLDRALGRYSQIIPDWHLRVTMWLSRTISQLRWNCRYVHVENILPRWNDRDVLFISGSRDSYIPYQLTRQLCRSTDHDPAVCHWVVQGATHNRERQTLPKAYDARIVRFFSQMVPDADLECEAAQLSPG